MEKIVNLLQICIKYLTNKHLLFREWEIEGIMKKEQKMYHGKKVTL